MAACPACGEELPRRFPFCPHCGVPLAGEGREQRKTVTILFCDVTGSTALGESTDPEALRALLARYFDRMKAIVDSHGPTDPAATGGSRGGLRAVGVVGPWAAI